MDKHCTVDTYTATIYCGLREGYDGPIYNGYEKLLQDYCNQFPIGLTVTQTRFLYTNGSEPGIIVGLINYPRFPTLPEILREKAFDIAKLLRAAAKQQRVTVVFPDITVMLEESGYCVVWSKK
mgnify:CR=1 FL=1